MGSPATQNLVIYQGDDFSLPLRFRGPDAVDGSPTYIDLTGYTARAQIRTTFAADPPLVELTATLDNQVANKGGVTLSLTHVQTSALPTTGTPVWDLQLTDPAGMVTTYLKGTVSVTPEVTR